MGLFLAGSAFAGEAHTTAGVCSDCHTMHYSAQHNFVGGPAEPLDGGGPYGGLLKISPNQLCEGCHDGTTSAPDVVGPPSDNYPRQAGALNSPSTGTYPAWTGHTLESKSVAPGGTWANTATGLACTDCHAAHGDPAQFRNLISSSSPSDKFYNTKVTYALGNVNDPTKDVWLRYGTTGAERYGIDSTQFNKPDPTKSAYADWCKACHTNFHGNKSTSNMYNGSDWVRHPTADASVSTTSASRWVVSGPNQPKVMVGAAANDFTPSCFTCHKAHGNHNPFGLIYMSGTGTVTEEGDSGTSTRDLCRKCHSQGG